MPLLGPTPLARWASRRGTWSRSGPAKPRRHLGAEALLHHPLDGALELAPRRLVCEDEADPHPGLRVALLRIAWPEDPGDFSLEKERLREGRQGEGEQAAGADLRRTGGLDESAALGDVLRIVGEERVHPLVVDAQPQRRARMAAKIVGRRHRRPV